MSATFERRVRRADLLIPLALFIGFLIAASVELIAERNTRQQTLAEMRRLEHVIVGQAYKPMDVDFMELLKTQDKDINRLLEITRQQNVVARSIKNLQDKRGKRISAIEADVKKLKTQVRADPSLPAASPSPKSIRKGGRPVK